MSTPTRVVFLGSGGFAVPILDALAADPSVALVGVVTTPSRPSGRSRELRPTPIGMRATALGIPVLTPERLRDPVAVDALGALHPDLMVLADYGRIVPPAVLDLAAHGALNLHPSLLPRHRGATPIPAAIAAGDTATGVSLMRMDAGIDTGPLVAQRRVALQGDEDAPTLEARLADEAARLLVASLPGWLAGTSPAAPQPAAGATHTRPFRRDDGRLDPQLPATVLERQVRALRPWPGTFLDRPDGRLLVHRARVMGAAASPPTRPGDLALHERALVLVTGDGLLALDEVQPAGGRPMSGEELARGRPGILVHVASPAVPGAPG